MATAEFSKFAGILSATSAFSHIQGLEFGASQVALVIKDQLANAVDARDVGSIPGS